MSKKYRKKPVVIDAIEYTPYAPTVLAWIDANVKDYCFDAEYLMINTLEGRMKTDPGDFIINATLVNQIYFIFRMKKKHNDIY